MSVREMVSGNLQPERRTSKHPPPSALGFARCSPGEVSFLRRRGEPDSQVSHSHAGFTSRKPSQCWRDEQSRIHERYDRDGEYQGGHSSWQQGRRHRGLGFRSQETVAKWTNFFAVYIVFHVPTRTTLPRLQRPSKLIQQ